MNRLEWILGILLVVLLVTIAVLSLVFWFGPQVTSRSSGNTATVIARRGGEVAPTSVFEGRTAKVAYAQAQQTAVDWQPDAVMLNSSATWPQGTHAQEILEGETTWGFTFYSPSATKIAIVSVVDNNVTVVSEGSHREANPVLAATGWNLDSDEVIELFLKEGGGQFLGAEGITTLTMKLDAADDGEDGRLDWLVNMISLQTGNALRMRIDATSGDILENQLAP